MLEHIIEDDQVVSEIARVVKPGGKVLIAVPADMRLWSAHDEAVGHVRRYTRDGLTALFERPEFRIDEVRSWNVLLRPVVAWRRKSSKGNDLTALPAVVNAGLTAIIRLERYLPVARRNGVTLLAQRDRGVTTATPPSDAAQPDPGGVGGEVPRRRWLVPPW